MKNKKIGIIGLGIMGSGIAANFLKKGYEVYVWNRSREKVNTMAAQGAIGCSTPAEVVRHAEVVIEVTANDESSRLVWSGKDGILSAAGQQHVLIAAATLSIEWVDELASLCKQRQLHFFDMAMTGGRIAAESGTLTLLCGGSEDGVKALEPTLAAVAAKILYFGQAGQGMRYKLILNFLQAVHIIGFGQAMQMARAHDMDLTKVSQALVDRPGGVITAIAQKTYFQAPDPITFSVEWITKDLRYAKKFASQLDVSLLDQVLAIYQEALAKGHGNQDWASINTPALND